MIDTLARLAQGPMVLHWTVVRETLVIRDLDVVREGFATQDGEILTITRKGLDKLQSYRDGSYLDF